MMNSSEIMSVTQLLGWKDVSTKRQRKNGTQIFELPIKVGRGNTNIKVGSFKSGYVRRMNHCYTPYQLNKCKPSTEYYKDYKWTERGTQEWTGKYRKYTGKTRIPIMDKTERLNYLISYCLKNFYIGYANQVADGKFIPKWEHEWKLKQAKDKYKKLDDFYESSKVFNDSMYEGRNDRVKELEEKLKEAEKNEFYPYSMEIRVNGQKYKVV